MASDPYHEPNGRHPTSSRFDDYVADVEARATEEERAWLDMWTAHFTAERRRLFDIPRQLVAACEAQHLTQRQLARVTGVRASTIRRIERGRTSPTVDTLAKLLAPSAFAWRSSTPRASRCRPDSRASPHPRSRRTLRLARRSEFDI